MSSSSQSAWSQLPLVLDAIVEGIGKARCGDVRQCMLRCFEYSGACSGHSCQGVCNANERKKFEDLIITCEVEMKQESDLSSHKFILEKLVLKKLLKIKTQFKTRCEGTHHCSSRCLGCSGHRDCRGPWREHPDNCSFSRGYRALGGICSGHVCGQTSNTLLVGELRDLKADVSELLQKPFGPDAGCLQSALRPEDSASQPAKRKAISCDVDADEAAVSKVSKSASMNSLAAESWISANGGPHCFLGDMLFQVKADPPCFLAAKDLLKGSLVVAADGENTLEVADIKIEQASQLIELHAEDSVPFKTTPSHRVMVPAYGAKPATMKAGDLKEDSFVLCSKNIAKRVTQVKTLEEHAAVFAISFKPDEPVEAFMPPSSSILTKGLTFKPTRRAGMNKKVGESPVPDDDAMSFKTGKGEYSD